MKTFSITEWSRKTTRELNSSIRGCRIGEPWVPTSLEPSQCYFRGEYVWKGQSFAVNYRRTRQGRGLEARSRKCWCQRKKEICRFSWQNSRHDCLSMKENFGASTSRPTPPPWIVSPYVYGGICIYQPQGFFIEPLNNKKSEIWEYPIFVEGIVIWILEWEWSANNKKKITLKLGHINYWGHLQFKVRVDCIPQRFSTNGLRSAVWWTAKCSRKEK